MGPYNNPLYLIRHLSSVLDKRATTLLQERLGISLSQYRILMVLEWTPHVSQRSIAHSLGQTEAAVSRQVKAMTEKGLVTTRSAPGNRRRYIIAPTPRGMQITESANGLLRRDLGSELSAFDTGLQELHRAICRPGKAGSCNHRPGF